MPKLINNGQVVTDEWLLLTEDTIDLEAGLPSGKVIIPASLWQSNLDIINKPDEDLGVWLDSHELADTLEGKANALGLIAINFPTFMDGRGFSTARLLRDSYGYQGELRAIGHIIRDQLFYLKRCGFSSFCFSEEVDLEVAAQSLNDFSETYQAACDQEQPLFRRRG